MFNKDILIEQFVNKRICYMKLFHNPDVINFRNLQKELREYRKRLLECHNIFLSDRTIKPKLLSDKFFEISGSKKKIQYRIIARPQVIISPYSQFSERSFTNIDSLSVNLKL